MDDYQKSQYVKSRNFKMVTRIKYLRRVSIFKSLKYLFLKYKFYSIGYDPNCSTIKYIPFANKEKVIQYARRSKILIINTSMHTYTINERFSLALPLGCIALVEKYPQYKYKNFLQKYGFSYSRSNLEKKLIEFCLTINIKMIFKVQQGVY